MMSNIQFLALNTSDKKDIFMAVSEQSGITAFAVEKDWWVSRCLEIIFKLDVAKHMVFKGGTSLSKA